MANVFLEFGFLVGIAAILSLVARMVKQPPLIAYLIAGIIAGPLILNVLPSEDSLLLFAHFGVAFLLFLVGLHLNFKSLRDVGGVSVIACVGAVVLMSGLSFFLSRLLGYGHNASLYLAAAFSFSSTIVVVKLLSDKHEIDTLHGRIALGILIVEDFVAALILMIVPVLGDPSSTAIVIQLAKALALIGAVVLVGWGLMPRVFAYAARWSETLFLVSVAWAVLVASVFAYFGFSLEIGALLAGLSIASSKYSFDISTKLRGLRDFFVVLFFVYFGSLLTGPLSADVWIAAGLFSVLILVGKPIIVMSFMRLFGYKRRTNFFAGIGLSQISEFSLILLLVGFTHGVIGHAMLTVGILVAFITLALSSYGLLYSHTLYRWFSPLLSLFGEDFSVDDLRTSKKYDIILFGYNRIGFGLVKAFERAGKSYLIVDYNPQTILDLTKKGVTCVYGDAHDSELLAELRLNEASVVISTIPDYNVNVGIAQAIQSNQTIFIPTSHSFEHTTALYKTGADYVIMPHFLGGMYVAEMLVDGKFSKSAIASEAAKQKKDLAERAREGHTHPHREQYGR